ncbi:MAG: CocE/NonD family hydrolase [Mariprofundales bacterium]|nr:CocE/NonD family hydrolase [Mariprofundales bacterium]
MNHQKLLIAGSAGKLQAIYQPGSDAQPAVVICHPHPLYGGTMRNKVVYWMARSFEEQGCHVLRFNFRGVEQSEGVWDDGVGEAQDASSALNWMAEKHPDSELWLAGFSFGCYAGLRAARSDTRVRRLLVVSPAVEHYDFGFMAGDQRPLTVVQGDADEIVSSAAVEAWAGGLPQSELHRITGASHFYPQHQAELQQALLDSFKSSNYSAPLENIP